MGPQDRFFSPETLTRFLASTFALSDAYDRMGVRLSGPKLPITTALDMPSEPILRGSVQVAGDGAATVMLADHGTTGGYPKIATVIGPDLSPLAQLRSRDSLRFSTVTPHAAILAARAQHMALTAYLAQIAEPRPSLAERLMSVNLISGVVNRDEV
jgi:allophanate hydrolase subunit 2